MSDSPSGVRSAMPRLRATWITLTRFDMDNSKKRLSPFVCSGEKADSNSAMISSSSSFSIVAAFVRRGEENSIGTRTVLKERGEGMPPSVLVLVLILAAELLMP